ncbi:hypothetical protein FB384_004929 [Prauserella sediminis]|uniref:DUF2786 domain-containing protein n=1 Tax=Prauserella sediminis TaxID=577680 RepID=A0A839XS13_9PSEU|nr:DUF2786 domain-containing protein [Prauserella sediminis]MBB3665970.1 hypothetical protein [Prauserella sediminis]
MTENKVLERVRRLLDKAAHPNTPPAEAELAQQRAIEIAERHGIDTALLEDGHVTGSDVETREIAIEPSYAQEKSMLLHVIAQTSNCRMVAYPRDWRYGKGRNRDGSRRTVFHYGKGVDAKVYGFPSDLERVELLFTLLMMQATKDMMRSMPKPGEDPGAHRRSFLFGFCDSVGARMQEMRQRAEREANAESDGRSTALVLRDRQALVEEFFQSKNPNAQARTASTSSRAGYQAGYAAGEQADLGQTAVSA